MIIDSFSQANDEVTSLFVDYRHDNLSPAAAASIASNSENHFLRSFEALISDWHVIWINFQWNCRGLAFMGSEDINMDGEREVKNISRLALKSVSETVSNAAPVINHHKIHKLCN